MGPEGHFFQFCKKCKTYLLKKKVEKVKAITVDP